MYNHCIETNFNKFAGIANPKEDTLDIWNRHQHYQVNQGHQVMKAVNQSQSAKISISQRKCTVDQHKISKSLSTQNSNVMSSFCIHCTHSQLYAMR